MLFLSCFFFRHVFSCVILIYPYPFLVLYFMLCLLDIFTLLYSLYFFLFIIFYSVFHIYLLFLLDLSFYPPFYLSTRLFPSVFFKHSVQTCRLFFPLYLFSFFTYTHSSLFHIIYLYLFYFLQFSSFSSSLYCPLRSQLAHTPIILSFSSFIAYVVMFFFSPFPYIFPLFTF